MNIENVNTQKSKDTFWIDEKGLNIPYNRTTKFERLAERQSAVLLKDAIKLNAQLSAFKDKVRKICKEVHEQFMKENNSNGTTKGNYTWYNFDRSIKVEVSITERIEFDDLTIKACKEKLDQFLSGNLESKDHFIKEMVLDAFQTSRGKLDAKKVMSLLRYKSKIKAPLFLEALELLEKSVRRPDSKTYFRVWAIDEDGKHQSIDLNFSSI